MASDHGAVNARRSMAITWGRSASERRRMVSGSVSGAAAG